MKTTREELLAEAKEQRILRISATDMNGGQLLTSPESALSVMRKYRILIEAAQFPSSEYWRLK